MDFSLNIGTSEVFTLDYRRNSFWGTESILVNGERIAGASPWNIGTHLSISLTKTLEFTVGRQERHQVVIVKIRPLLLAGFRPQTYRVLVDGKCVLEKTGF